MKYYLYKDDEGYHWRVSDKQTGKKLASSPGYEHIDQCIKGLRKVTGYDGKITRE